MRTRGRLLLAGITAALLLSVAVGTATANRLRINELRIKIVWPTARPMVFEGGFGEPVRCRVTLEGSFHSETIPKTIGLLVGYITRAASGPCTGGNVTVQTLTLPWHIRYAGFTGTLPIITRVRLLLIDAGFRIETGVFSCLSRTSAERPAAGWAIVTKPEAFYKIRTFVLDETVTIPLAPAPSEFCVFSVGRLSGTGDVYELGTTEQEVLLKLI